jgi:Family of unknown function (DUF6318)
VRHVAAVVLSAACSFAGLSACTDSNAANDAPRTTLSTHSASSSSPSPSPSAPPTAVNSPAVPKMPAAARKLSAAGAKAFVRYYMTALNYSWHSGSSRLARSGSTAACLSCRGIAQSIAKMQKSGGFYRGGDWRVERPVLIASTNLRTPIVHAALIQTAGRWKKSADDHLRELEPSRQYVDFHLQRTPGGWRVTSMVLA